MKIMPKTMLTILCWEDLKRMSFGNKEQLLKAYTFMYKVPLY